MDIQIAQMVIADNRLKFTEKAIMLMVVLSRNPYLTSDIFIHETTKIAENRLTKYTKKLIKFGYLTPRYAKGLGQTLIGYSVNIAQIQSKKEIPK
jgi:hypothetical protein